MKMKKGNFIVGSLITLCVIGSYLVATSKPVNSFSNSVFSQAVDELKKNDSPILELVEKFKSNDTETLPDSTNIDLNFDGEHYFVTVNNNMPAFNKTDLDTNKGAWQEFSDIDELNRVGTANALLHKSMMPTEEREPLFIKPTGWRQKSIGSNSWLYNRCHLIGFQLTGENNNINNLFTGTELMNQTHMVEYENQIANYLRSANNFVRYRVTPHFQGNDLVCKAVQMEAQSIEDDTVCFNILLYNVQDNYKINYADGTSQKGEN